MLKHSRSRNSRRRLCLEALEDRLVLSGNVGASQNANGVLTLTGDTGDNSIILIPAQQNGISILGQMGTTVNGEAAAGPFPNVTGLNVQFQNGNDTIQSDGVSPSGAVSIVEGTGNDSIGLGGSTFQQLDVTVGKEQDGATGTIMASIDDVIITGSHANINLLNESGISGHRLNGPGKSPGSLINLSISGLQFTSGGSLNVRADDGIGYFDSAHQQLTSASTVQINNVSTTLGNANIAIGDHYQNVQTNQSGAANLSLSVGSDNDIVNVIGNAISRRETIAIGNNSPYPVPIMPSPSVLVNGTVGDNLANDGLQLIVGSNTNTTISAWPVEIKNTHVLGNLLYIARDGVAATIDPTDCSQSLDITMGSGGVNGLESLTMLGVMTSDPVITFNSNVGDTVRINFNKVASTEQLGLFYMQDFGRGTDLVNLTDFHVAGFLVIVLSSSGKNVVTAHNVTTAFGVIYGGVGFGDKYIDQGGNSGYFVFGFP